MMMLATNSNEGMTVTDADLAERLELLAGHLNREGIRSLSDAEIMALASAELRGLVRSIRLEGFDRIPKLVSDLAFRGVGFPPQSGMN